MSEPAWQFDPDDAAPPSALQAYGAGRWVRRGVYAAAVAATAGAIAAGVLYARHREAVLRDPAAAYRTAEGDAGARPRTFHWSSGRARLGLSRTPPAADRIVLPDRIVELAPDVSHAQVDVEVRDGRTVRLEVLTGAIAERPRGPSDGPPPP